MVYRKLLASEDGNDVIVVMRVKQVELIMHQRNSYLNFFDMTNYYLHLQFRKSEQLVFLI